MRRRKLTDELRRFFGREPHELPVVSRSFSPVDLPNLHLAIEDYAREHHFDEAMRELLFGGEELTRNLLGFATEAGGRDAAPPS